MSDFDLIEFYKKYPSIVKNYKLSDGFLSFRNRPIKPVFGDREQILALQFFNKVKELDFIIEEIEPKCPICDSNLNDFFNIHFDCKNCDNSFITISQLNKRKIKVKLKQE